MCVCVCAHLLHNILLLRNGVTTVVLPLRHARHLRHRTLVEVPDHVILEDVAALDLAARLIGGAIARVYADDIGEAVWVGYALEEGEAALVCV